MSQYDQLKQLIDAIALQTIDPVKLHTFLVAAKREIAKLETEAAKPKETSLLESQEAIVDKLQNQFLSLSLSQQSAQDITMLREAIAGLLDLQSVAREIRSRKVGEQLTRAEREGRIQD